MLHTELSQAMDALGGKRPGAAALLPGTPRTPAAGEPAFGLQPHLLRLPAVHNLALSVHYAGVEASRQPQDFGLVYKFGLGLQASR